MALVHYDTLKDEEAKKSIAQLTVGYNDKTEYFVDRLAQALARIAASRHPAPVIVRMSDFKTNEYANLLGGAAFATAKIVTLTGTDLSNGYADFTVLKADLGADGSKALSSRITDVAGNLGTTSNSLSFTLDTTAPAAPTLAETGTSDLADSLMNNAEAATTTLRATLPTTPIMSGVAITRVKGSSPAATRAARSASPTMSAPAARASAAFSPRANTATTTRLPEPCGSGATPRTIWSVRRGSTPSCTCSATVEGKVEQRAVARTMRMASSKWKVGPARTLMSCAAVFFFSNPHCSFAPSIWRRLLMQEFFDGQVLVVTKFGRAMATTARSTMMKAMRGLRARAQVCVEVVGVDVVRVAVALAEAVVRCNLRVRVCESV
jgi:hypothetical protein